MIPRRFSFRTPAALLLLASTLGCELSTGPGSPSDVTFTASMSRTVIPLGESATLTIRLRNGGTQPVTIDFPHSCQILPYVDNAAGEPVFPEQGWGCLTVITKLHLEPGQEIVQGHEIRGGVPAPAIYTGALLPPGEYQAYAELGERPRPYASTNVVRFTVVD